ncbi:MAG: response regulator transcription factor [Chloroflexi bacterium]|nr:response regulator transcription factor [Chloroflexota bacterium]
MDQRIRVFIVDDHEVVRVGLRRMLELEQDLLVVGEASSAEEAVARVQAAAPHVVLMDIKMPNVNGLEATRHLKSLGTPAEIIVLSLYDEYLAQAIEAGASGYLVKDARREELVAAIRRVARGELALGGSLAKSPEITERTIGHLRDLLRHSGTSSPQDASSQPAPSAGPGAPPDGNSPSSGLHPSAEALPGSGPAHPMLDGSAWGPSVPPGSEDLFAGDVELVVMPPFEAPAVVGLHHWLRGVAQAEVEESAGSWQGGISLRLLLRRPLPLLRMLASAPGVAEANEDVERAQDYGPRLLKRRRDVQPSLEPPRRVMLRLVSPPGQP